MAQVAQIPRLRTDRSGSTLQTGVGNIQSGLLNRQLDISEQLAGILDDPAGISQRRRGQLTSTAAGQGRRTGARLSQQAGNPALQQAIELLFLNRATGAANVADTDLFGPQGQVQMAQLLQSLFGPESLTALQGLTGIQAEPRGPSAAESILSILPSVF